MVETLKDIPSVPSGPLDSSVTSALNRVRPSLSGTNSFSIAAPSCPAAFDRLADNSREILPYSLRLSSTAASSRFASSLSRSASSRLPVSRWATLSN